MQSERLDRPFLTIAALRDDFFQQLSLIKTEGIYRQNLRLFDWLQNMFADVI